LRKGKNGRLARNDQALSRRGNSELVVRKIRGAQSAHVLRKKKKKIAVLGGTGRSKNVGLPRQDSKGRRQRLKRDGAACLEDEKLVWLL